MPLPSSALEDLRRPFTPEAIKFKVQTQFGKPKPTGGLVVAYIDARLVIERLNHVAKWDWSATYGRTTEDANLFWCSLRVGDTERRDVGYATPPDDKAPETVKGMYAKALVSDALKRAAVQFGVGISLYSLPQQKLWAADQGPKPTELKRTNDRLYMTEDNQAYLREQYALWLRQTGVQAFGDPLDHGDAPEAVGDVEADPDTGEVVGARDEKPLPEPPELAVGQADPRVGEAMGLRDRIADQMTAGQFDQFLNTARESDERMDQFVAYLRKLATKEGAAA